MAGGDPSRVFVSSTTKDLGEARERVCKQLLQLDLHPESMDWYASDPSPPKLLDDVKIKSCGIFVIIVGHLYGSCPPGEEKSFTELEYETARALGRPVYPFLASDRLPSPPSLREEDATFAKLNAFRERLGRDHLPRLFDNIDQLCAGVAAALATSRSGPKTPARRLAVPRIPAPYLAHPYPLQRNFTGRLKERAMLTEWVQDSSGAPMLSLIGMGGMGKSALTWFWLREDLPEEKVDFRGAIWWSFYEREADFRVFLNRALLYVGGGEIAPEEIPSDYERMQRLSEVLRADPFLLILDGVERLLRVYHALDAAYRGDDITQEERGDHLLCADSNSGFFLEWLASTGVKSKTLLTSRLQPKELDGLDGCRREDLGQLDPDDAVEFMRRQGIKGPRGDIVRACEPYDFLPLCLRLLSGAIRRDPKKPGDIEVAQGWRPPENLPRRQHHILQLSYDTMRKDRRELLSRIAAMRGPVDYETAAALSSYGNEEDLREALWELEDRGLLFRQEGGVQYDLHPIVRQYAYERLGNKKTVHESLMAHFSKVPLPEKVETLEDLLPTIELFHHTIASNAYDEAYRIYRDRLSSSLYYVLGAYDTIMPLLEAFFPDGVDSLPRLKKQSQQSYVLAALGNALALVGQSRDAALLQQRANAIDEELGDRLGVAIGLCNLARTERRMGKLKSAELSLLRSLDLTRTGHDEPQEGIAHQELGLSLVYMGQYEESEREYEKAMALFVEYEEYQSQCIVWTLRALLALQMNKPKEANELLNRARDLLLERGATERDSIVILWLSGAANRRLTHHESAEEALSQSLSRSRRIRLVEFESDILLELARLQWEIMTGSKKVFRSSERDKQVEQLRSLVREALDIADRCENRLQQADIHNFLAEMAFDEGDMDTARKRAESARERAHCDGPPHCYKKALDEAEQMLKRLGSK